MMIRNFLPHDIDPVMDIWLQGNLDAHPFISPAYWTSNLANVKAAILQAEVYCAVDNSGNIQGFIGLQGDYIAGLFVTKQARGHHIGTALLDTAKNTRQILTLDVYLKNTRALNFYQHHGFTISEYNADEARMTWQAKNNL